jgi:hypothetical protein
MEKNDDFINMFYQSRIDNMYLSDLYQLWRRLKWENTRFRPKKSSDYRTDDDSDLEDSKCLNQTSYCADRFEEEYYDDYDEDE